jgi:CheY-like chemotaxis protein
MIRLALETSSYDVGEAADGIEAFAILGGDPDWDAILLDQRMPVMEGIEVLRRLKVLAPSAHVVMMTAFPSVELAVEVVKLGATDFLRKPMTPEVVRKSVAAAIAKNAELQSIGNHGIESRHTGTPSVTLNGFTILHIPDVTGGFPQSAKQRRFIVRKPNGDEQHIVVEITAEAIRTADQSTHHAQIDEAFWTEQAEGFLRDFIWNDGNIPAGGKLILKSADRDSLEKLAREWRRHDEEDFDH